ncbi:MAG TPA: hypothetical protein PLY87_20010, partial [Planctomycetaceae bacterium]|nr:hypothetical protein [Planctomycetaceae bacterium]
MKNLNYFRLALAGVGLFCCIALVGLKASVAATRADDVSSRKSIAAGTAAFGRMSIEQIRDRLQQWLTLSRTDEATSKRVLELWVNRAKVQDLNAEQTLDLLIDSFALADASVQQLVESCRSTG